MFEEDDYPDYFLGDDEQEQPRQESASHSGYDSVPKPGQTISFGSEDRDNTNDGDRLAGRDERSAAGGCFGIKGTLGRLGCMVSTLFMIIVALIIYVRYLTPTVSDAVMDVYVISVQQRGVFFKTYEAEIVDPGRLDDTSKSYTHAVAVSIEDEDLARTLQQIQSTDRIVRLHYKQYSATLPWRGESKTVIISAD